MNLVKLAYDTKLGRAGCAIVQAALGGTVPTAQLDRLQPWTLAPTPDMVVYQMTEHDLELLCRVHEQEARSRGGS